MVSLSIVGVGRVGGEVAFLASFLGLVDELNLIEVREEYLCAQVLDLRHAMPELRITTDREGMKQSDICVYTAGNPRDPSVNSRADLLDDNLGIAKSCADSMSGFEGILITVANPSDALNHYLSRRLELDPSRCIGFGGQLDSARFAVLLAERDIRGEAWVLGEHGEHQVPLFSLLERTVEIGERMEILERLRGSSMEIIRGKGGTLFGPAAHIVELISAIVEDARITYPCSCIPDGEYGIEGCSIGLPAVVGKGGIASIEEWGLDGWEQERLAEAARFLQGLARKMEPFL